MTSKDGIKAALSDYMERNTYYREPLMTQSTVEAKRSSIALWKNRKPESPVIYSGNVQITPELLSELLAQSPDDRGYHNLRVVLFRNQSEHPKAPGARGIVEMPQVDDVEDF